MLFAVDVGNSHTVSGIFDKGKLVGNWRMQSRQDRTADELAIRYHGLFQMAGIAPERITGFIVASVVPVLETSWLHFARSYLTHLRQPPLAVNHTIRLGMKVAIEGKLRYSSWDKDGQRRSKLEVIVDEIELMSQKQGQQAPQGYQQQYAPQPAPQTAPQQWNAQQAYQQALRLYQGGFYNQALRHLSFAERSGNGSRIEQSALFLLMQSHEKLRNCESVILTGQRFAARFATNPQSAEALYSVGNCQWNMQQRDIARTTWRKLIQTYPQSAAARRANQRLTANR